jgi:hypothetical protein
MLPIRALRSSLEDLTQYLRYIGDCRRTQQHRTSRVVVWRVFPVGTGRRLRNGRLAESATRVQLRCPPLGARPQDLISFCRSATIRTVSQAASSTGYPVGKGSGVILRSLCILARLSFRALPNLPKVQSISPDPRALQFARDRRTIGRNGKERCHEDPNRYLGMYRRACGPQPVTFFHRLPRKATPRSCMVADCLHLDAGRTLSEPCHEHLLRPARQYDHVRVGRIGLREHPAAFRAPLGVELAWSGVELAPWPVFSDT